MYDDFDRTTRRAVLELYRSVDDGEVAAAVAGFLDRVQAVPPPLVAAR